jgi:hypothetical protein
MVFIAVAGCCSDAAEKSTARLCGGAAIRKNKKPPGVVLARRL